jgi:hypothetical protein
VSGVSSFDHRPDMAGNKSSGYGIVSVAKEKNKKTKVKPG